MACRRVKIGTLGKGQKFQLYGHGREYEVVGIFKPQIYVYGNESIFPPVMQVKRVTGPEVFEYFNLNKKVLVYENF